MRTARLFLVLLLVAAGVSACTPVGVPARFPGGWPTPSSTGTSPRGEGQPRPEGPETPQPGAVGDPEGRMPPGRLTPRRFDTTVPLPLPEEVRALWAVRHTLNRPQTIRAMVDRAARAGFNTLIVQVRGRGDAYYLSRWEPRPEEVLEQGDAFDPLALVIQEAHARGARGVPS